MDNDLFCRAGGFSSMSNGYIEKVRKQMLSGIELKILLCVMRYSNGYQRDKAKLSATFIAEWTGQSVSGIKKGIRSLREKGLLIAETDKRGLTNYLAFDASNITSTEMYTSTEIYTSQKSELVPKSNQDQYRKVDRGSTEIYTQINKNINKTLNKNIICPFFEELWKLYPNKKGKNAVNKNAMAELVEAGFERVAAAIEIYKQEIEGREMRYVLHGSTFFNGRWKDYAPAAIEEKEPAESTDRFSKLAPADRTRLEQKGAILPNGALDYSYLDDDDLELVRKAGID